MFVGDVIQNGLYSRRGNTFTGTDKLTILIFLHKLDFMFVDFSLNLLYCCQSDAVLFLAVLS